MSELVPQPANNSEQTDIARNPTTPENIRAGIQDVLNWALPIDELPEGSTRPVLIEHLRNEPGYPVVGFNLTIHGATEWYKDGQSKMSKDPERQADIKKELERLAKKNAPGTMYARFGALHPITGKLIDVTVYSANEPRNFLVWGIMFKDPGEDTDPALLRLTALNPDSEIVDVEFHDPARLDANIASALLQQGLPPAETQ